MVYHMKRVESFQHYLSFHCVVYLYTPTLYSSPIRLVMFILLFIAFFCSPNNFITSLTFFCCVLFYLLLIFFLSTWIFSHYSLFQSTLFLYVYEFFYTLECRRYRSSYFFNHLKNLNSTLIGRNVVIC